MAGAERSDAPESANRGFTLFSPGHADLNGGVFMNRRMLAAILGVCLWPAAGQAGLYNPAEPTELTLPPDFTQFRVRLNDLRSVAPDEYPGPEYPLRIRYLLMAQTREVPTTWNVTRRLSLSAYWIRRQKYDEAVPLLERLKKEDRRNFLARANLALAFFRDPDFNTDVEVHFDRALLNVNEALAVWPADWNQLRERDLESLGDAIAWTTSLGLPPGPALRFPSFQPKVRNDASWLMQMGWDPESYQRYRLTETYFRRLLQVRRAEFVSTNKTPEKSQSVDALFGTAKDPVRFVGGSGKFEPGQLAKQERDKLPPDALAIVQQLLLWMPDDPRLYWLLAELYSVQGKTAEEKKAGIAAAWDIFKELGDLRTGAYRDTRNSPREFHEHYKILAEYARTHDLTPAVDTTIGDPPPPAPPDTGALGMDWNSLVIGFGAGVVLVLFVLFQIQEIRRRRQQRAAMLTRPARPAGSDQIAGTNPLGMESHPIKESGK